MKRMIFALMLVSAPWPSQAQLFSNESLGGAALGGLVGGIIGNNSRHRTGEGVAIGAGAGLLLGALAHDSRRDYYYSEPAYLSPGRVVTPNYYYAAPRPNYAVTGALLGGIAGGVIGNNNRHRTGEGIAIGVGTGLLFGSLAEQNARRHVYYVPSAPTYVVASPTVAAPPPPAAVPAPEPAVVQPAPVVKNSLGSPSAMSGANSLFGR